MAEWEKKTLRLKDGHGWSARPGCNVLVADRGAVRFDYPEGWVVVPDERGSLKLHDKHGIALPAAMAKVTWKVADILGLKDRGHLKPRLRADIVRFKVLGATPVIATAKPGEEEGWIALRLQNLSTDPAHTEVAFAASPRAAKRSDPIEHAGSDLKLDGGNLTVSLDPLAIETVLVRFRA